MGDYDARDYDAGLHRPLDALLAENAALKAKIARVEAFAELWESSGHDLTMEYADDLRAALADESAP